jgi:hypothetical protein
MKTWMICVACRYDLPMRISLSRSDEKSRRQRAELYLSTSLPLCLSASLPGCRPHGTTLDPPASPHSALNRVGLPRGRPALRLSDPTCRRKTEAPVMGADDESCDTEYAWCT